jgi:hypothetical protein
VESLPSNVASVYVEVANEDPGIPGAVSYLFCMPNPFRELAVIRYAIKAPAQLSLDVYNLKGQKVRSLESGSKPSGEYLSSWDGCDDKFQPVSSGIYFLRLQAGGRTILTRKMVKV